MSKENAKAFVQAVLDDKELREKTANMKPEEAVPLAKEMGYDFTLEEFTDVMNEDRELSPDELEAAAGGDKKAQNDMAKKAYERGLTTGRWEHANGLRSNEALYCYGNPKGPKHNYIYTYEDRTFLCAWTRTYEIATCSRCGRVQEVHVKFGDDGTIIHCS